MCSIIGINGKNIQDKVFIMLDTLNHRGPDGHGVYSDNRVFYNEDIKKMSGDSSFVLGHNLLSIIGNNESQPLKSNNLVLVSNAELYNYKELINQFNITIKTNSDCEVILKLIEYYYEEDNLKEAVLKTITHLDGDYAFCVSDGNNYMVIRDEIGVKPVYYGFNRDYFAFASEQKALKEIGLDEIYNLKPTEAIFNNEIIKIRKEKVRSDFFMDYDYAKDSLKKVIMNSVSKRTQNLDKVALLFSAGVDSTLIAVLLKQLGIDVTLYTIGTENSQDLKFAIKTASEIGIPIKTKVINKVDVENAFETVINTIEDTNLMKIGVGMTIYLTSKLAKEDNQKVIFSGQGADELFAGYNRYKNKFNTPLELIEELDYDLNEMYEVNLERDDKATMANSMELRVPYLDKDVIEVAMQMPIKFLLNSNSDNLRKHILREVAYELGVPHNIAYRPKKAAQYGTGIDKIIRKKIIKQDYFKNLIN
ncbi:MAG: asparagine synthetase B [Methanosphaera stadtmanae]|nr:asparagine synthetase B [Methanosphaera stadtmanae]